MSVSLNPENTITHPASPSFSTDTESIFTRTVGEQKQDDEELFVFGYSCKLFRDDFAAKAIDRGQHLIPWNGDESLMIDRYDCRGHITDVLAWDADLLKQENKISELSENERAVENLCDEERYHDLYKDNSESYECDDERRRLRSETLPNSAVPYNYEENNLQNQQASTDDFEPFYPSEKLRLPYGMEIPETVKMNAVIAKTAAFVTKHGLQMEILLKTKQSNNPQFDFLKYDNYLNPYYKHLVTLIKNNLYSPEQENEKNNDNAGDEDDDDDGMDGDSYLHPLLTGASHKSEPPPKPFPTVNLDSTPYGKLIRCLGLIQQREDLKRNKAISTAREVAEEKKETASSETSVPSHIVPPPPDVFPIIDKLADYVARNGQVFEDSVRAKNDPRFDFVDEKHVHHSYYVFKKEYYLQEIQKRKRLEEKKRRDLEDRKRVHGSGIKFLIKPKESVETSLPLAPLHLGGDDDDGENTEEDSLKVEKPVQKCDLDREIEEQLFIGIGPQGPPKEVIDQMKQLQMENERKKDKLLVVARVKLAQESKEKQEERKRKADLFIKQLKETKERQAAVAVEKMDREAAEKAALKNSLMAKLLSVNTVVKDRAARSCGSDSYKHSRPSSSFRSSSPDYSTRKSSPTDSRHKRRQEHRRRSPSKSSHHSPPEKNSRSDSHRSSRSSPGGRSSNVKSDRSHSSKNILDLEYLPSKKRSKKH